MADVRVFLEEVNQMGQTPLHYAAKNNLYDVANFLVNKCKVNICYQNKMGNTALHVAVLNERKRITELLIDARIDVLIENKEGYNCLVHA